MLAIALANHARIMRDSLGATPRAPALRNVDTWEALRDRFADEGADEYLDRGSSHDREDFHSDG